MAEIIRLVRSGGAGSGRPPIDWLEGRSIGPFGASAARFAPVERTPPKGDELRSVGPFAGPPGRLLGAEGFRAAFAFTSHLTLRGAERRRRGARIHLFRAFKLFDKGGEVPPLAYRALGQTGARAAKVASRASLIGARVRLGALGLVSAAGRGL